MVDRLLTYASTEFDRLPFRLTGAAHKIQINSSQDQLDLYPVFARNWDQIVDKRIWGVTWNDQYNPKLNHRIRGYVATNFGYASQLDTLKNLVDKYQASFDFVNSSENMFTRIWAYVLINPQPIKAPILKEIACKLKYGPYEISNTVLR